MRHFLFPADSRLEYVFTGKFIAPDKNWKHELFDLNEFELIVETSTSRKEVLKEEGDAAAKPPQEKGGSLFD